MKPRDVERRLVMCEKLLQWQKRKDFLHRVVIGYEKWIHYNNPKRRTLLGKLAIYQHRRQIHGSRLLLCIWWDQLGGVYYELLKPTETITEYHYQLQMMRLGRALKKKRSLYEQRHNKAVLHHDNAKPYVTKRVKKKTYLETLKMEVLPPPIYSLDIAPSDYHLFRSIAHSLAKQHFHSYEDAKKWDDLWLASKDESFFQHKIQMLPESWGWVVASEGQYVQ